MCTTNIMRISEPSGYAPTLDKLIKMLCLDYQRRAGALEEGIVGRRVAMEYRYLNYRMIEAAGRIVGESDALQYIKEIGDSVGYAKSEILIGSEPAYKRRKQAVKLGIARALYLLD